MPLIQVKLIEEVFTPAQKKEIIAKLTDAMVAIEGENLRPYTLVTVEDVRSGDWEWAASRSRPPMSARSRHKDRRGYR